MEARASPDNGGLQLEEAHTLIALIAMLQTDSRVFAETLERTNVDSGTVFERQSVYLSTLSTLCLYAPPVPVVEWIRVSAS